ncbi:MAG: hypothetical protein FJW29_06070 [Acidobacteria bacterium]|nr:hypothetical protein [Acidobacteriota bacterium]
MSAWFLAFAGLGLAAASWSTWVHYTLIADPLSVPSCDINAVFSCSQAYTSEYGSVGGVSVALIGALFFAFVLLLTFLTQQSRTARANLPLYLFAASTVGLAVVLYLGYISWFVLGTVCLLCVGSYVAVIGLFLSSGAAAKEPMSSLPSRLSRDLSTLFSTPSALATTVAFVVVAAAAVTMFPHPSEAAATASVDGQTLGGATGPAIPAAQLKEFEDYLAAQPRETMNIPTNGAAVVVVKFNDYQCPACGQTHLALKPVKEKWVREGSGRVQFVTMDFALERECNAGMQSDVHLAACDAAVAVRLAREKGKGDALEDWLFANQPIMTPASVRQAAADVAGVTDMDARYADVLTKVKADTTMGVQLKVASTPTFFLNGIRLPGLRPEFFDAAIAWELKRISGAK